MTRLSRTVCRAALAAIAGMACLLLNDQRPFTNDGSLVSEAQARVGRPLTPVSYAGVARRTTRRAVAGTAAAAGAYGAYAYGTSGCAQVVNAYGQVVYQCP